MHGTPSGIQIPASSHSPITRNPPIRHGIIPTDSLAPTCLLCFRLVREVPCRRRAAQFRRSSPLHRRRRILPGSSARLTAVSQHLSISTARRICLAIIPNARLITVITPRARINFRHSRTCGFAFIFILRQKKLHHLTSHKVT